MIEANKARINSDVANMQAIFTNTVGKIMAENEDVVVIKNGQLNTVTSGVSKTDGVAKYEIKGADEKVAVEGNIMFKAGQKSGTTYYTGKELPIYNSETKWYVDEQGLISVEVGGTKYGEGETSVVKGDPDTLKDGVTKVGEKVTESAKEYQDAKGNVATIPIDFAIVPGKTDIENGLVISDVENDTEDTGNQFVWVPVDNMTTFVREVGYYNGQIQTETNGIVDFSKCSEPYETNLGEKQEYENMLASVKEYGGFYIGRYEISNDGAEKAQSKKGKEPWVNIKWGNSMTETNGGIVEKARNMYREVESEKGKVVSTLVYGVAWDETIRFIKKNYPNIEKDSSGYGNYEKSSTIPTGSKDEYALNNIYDIAGNVWEWTMEVYSTSTRAHRGGSYLDTELCCPLSSRGINNITYDIINAGGRAQLYIK